MKTFLLIMTGVAFTLGVVFGLLMQLPIDNTLPARPYPSRNLQSPSDAIFRSRRSLSQDHEQVPEQTPDASVSTTSGAPADLGSEFSRPDSRNTAAKNPPVPLPYPVKDQQHKSKHRPVGSHTGRRQDSARRQGLLVPPRSQIFNVVPRADYVIGSRDSLLPSEDKKSPLQLNENIESKQFRQVNFNNTSDVSKVISVKLNLQKLSSGGRESQPAVKQRSNTSMEDIMYLKTLVSGVVWSSQLEHSCPQPFQSSEAETWRQKIDQMDVVHMEEGCGRMQNRLVTFRDASKACVRYRLNTDQIQGEIYSYYLARLLNISNIPPSMLGQVDAVAPKWRTVHLKMSLAQWADSKIVVLTKHIQGLQPAHIPVEFREEGGTLEPTFHQLGSKSREELCELLQWSDLIVFDYLTANLDRVINNLFNRQWNDQMMNSPAHNLERRGDGALVFLDNESGLFHGYRLLDKYAVYHRALLKGLCVFRASTAQTIKRLHDSSNLGEELHRLFARHEILHKHLPVMNGKNMKILQHRLEDVYEQIRYCESLFDR